MVYAEPALVSAAASEFEETEKFLEIAESLTTPYCWGRYDMLVLPPGFPFGGNITFNFLTGILYNSYFSRNGESVFDFFDAVAAGW